ncbi:hypothetical protein [Atlantibacter hermannii]|uniref:hypothetical protein n=1 Tax=Atlantibacter hermannii TaxID=565 RepID=UPI0018E3DACF|nr:hypothetical protein [Atlantibacter hermannii]
MAGKKEKGPRHGLLNAKGKTGYVVSKQGMSYPMRVEGQKKRRQIALSPFFLCLLSARFRRNSILIETIKAEHHEKTFDHIARKNAP